MVSVKNTNCTHTGNTEPVIFLVILFGQVDMCSISNVESSEAQFSMMSSDLWRCQRQTKVAGVPFDLGVQVMSADILKISPPPFDPYDFT